MKYLKRPKLTLLLLVFFGALLHAQINSDFDISFEKKVEEWLAENNVPAVGIGLIENGEIKYVRVFGELKKGTPAPDNTIFSIASITKPVVTMLILKLAESGQWDLDEPLYHYWIDPDIANDPRHKELTSRHVLTHQTGFPNWRFQTPSKKLNFDFDPGTNYHYSGEGFVYLERALENKFKKSLSELADSLLFIPLNMGDSRLHWDKNMDSSRFAHWHDSDGNLYNPSTPKNEKGGKAAGSMLTTIEDFCKFGIDVINGGGLSQDIYNEMIKPYTKIQQNYVQGLGWKVITDLPNGEYALEHGGSQRGVQTKTILLPKSKRGIVVLTNADNGFTVYNHIIKESINIGGLVLESITGSNNHKKIFCKKKF